MGFMNVHLNMSMAKPAFLGWVQEREERYELVLGRIMMMTGRSRGHAITTRRLAVALEKRLDHRRWTVLTSDFGVDLGPSTVRYPDVLVDVAGGDLNDLTATSPVLIAEVLSPSSSATDDLGDKAAEYLRLSTLLGHVVLASDQPKAWVWSRDETGFPPGPNVAADPDGVIRIPALGIALPLAELYTEL